MTLVTFLVKSEKYGKICLACLDESNQWIRPIKPGGFTGADIIMDNGAAVEIFDAVDVRFGAPCPIKHHTENIKFKPEGGIRFVRKLSETEKRALLAGVTDPRLITRIESKYELHDEIIKTGRSLALVGPIAPFNIQYANHPRLWIVGKNNSEFDIPCTDLQFCAFIRSKSTDFEKKRNLVNSQEIVELKDKQIYLVIGLTGDSIDENGKIISHKYAPEGSLFAPRYWPLAISVLTVPDYS